MTMEPTDEHIRLLLQRYKNGQCTAEEIGLLHAWLDARAALEEGPAFAGEADMEHVRKTIEGRIWGALFPAKGRITRMRWVYAAAAILVLGVTGWIAYAVQRPPVWDTYATTDQSRCVSLEDGSKIWMDHFTRLRVRRDFGRHRDVTLEKGTVFCDVAHDTRHPFQVISGSFNVRDLGTAFSVSRYERWQGVKVSVVHGVVEVNRGHRVVDTLYKGERLRYSDGVHPEIVRDSTSEGEADGWFSNNIVLHDLTLEEIAQWIEMHYGLRVVNLTRAAAGRTYEVQLDKGAGARDMLDILNLILQNNHIELTRSDSTITIRSANNH